MSEFYKSKKWLRLRSAVLRRDGYMCQLSKRYGKMLEANTVHHIFPRDEYPEYELEAWNLISLTTEMHNKLHDRTTNKLTEDGIKLLKRTAQKNDIRIPLRYQ